ncbi:MAG: NAD(P)-binding domain-containing protein, partial [Terriglobales bacterium]
GIETRVFGEPMAFWKSQMPAGMFLRSNWKASHIADPDGKVTLDAYCDATSNPVPAPIPLEQFVEYGLWYQRQAVPQVEKCSVTNVDASNGGFNVTLACGEVFKSRRVILATGIANFAWQPEEFVGIPRELASHASAHTDLSRFKGQRVVVIGGGQSALESAALLHESGADVEVIVRKSELNWVGVHYRIHHLGPLSWLLYSDRDVGPAGLSRLVSVPRLFRVFPREFQNRAAYRAIRPAGSGWLRPRLSTVQITLGRKVVSAASGDSKLLLQLSDGTDRLVDHAILATGYRVDTSKYEFLPQGLQARLQTVNGHPILKSGLESSIAGLHFLGKPASWSFGPLLCFVSGTEFAAKELVRSISRTEGTRRNG